MRISQRYATIRQSIERNTEGFSERAISSVETCLFFMRTARRIFGALDGHLGNVGLSHGRFGLLMQLDLCGGEACPGDLADILGVSRATVTGLVDRLQDDGLVVRASDATDKRMLKVQLTAAGEKQLHEALPGHARRLAETMSGLDDEELRQLRTLLAKIARHTQTMR